MASRAKQLESVRNPYELTWKDERKRNDYAIVDIQKNVYDAWYARTWLFSCNWLEAKTVSSADAVEQEDHRFYETHLHTSDLSAANASPVYHTAVFKIDFIVNGIF